MCVCKYKLIYIMYSSRMISHNFSYIYFVIVFVVIVVGVLNKLIILECVLCVFFVCVFC